MCVKVEFGKRVYQLYLEAGISQKELAYRAGIDPCHLSRVINGSCNISIVNMDKIAKGLGISLRELLNDKRFDRPQQ